MDDVITVTETPPITIREQAAKALRDVGGYVPAAVDLFEARVRHSPPLRDALIDHLIRNACYEAIRSCIRAERKTVWDAVRPTDEQEVDRIMALASGTSSALLDFRLPGGKKLRHATGAEILTAANFYSTQAANMAAKALWLNAVGKLVPIDDVAGKHVTERQLIELKLRVEGAEA